MLEWITEWMQDNGAVIPPKKDDTADRELEVITSEYGELPAELREWVLGDFGRRGYFHMFPVDGGVCTALLPNDPSNRSFLIGPDGLSIDEGYEHLVACGAAASHPLVLASNIDTWIVAECSGPRAGWLFYLDSFYPRDSSQPHHRAARPIARSITECFEGYKRMVETGVLGISRWGLGTADFLDPPLPPRGAPMTYAGWASVSGSPGTAQGHVVPGSVREVLGFDPPTEDEEPAGLRTMFAPQGGWEACQKRVVALRAELGLLTPWAS